MTQWNVPSRKVPSSNDSAVAEPTRETERPSAAVPPAATPSVSRECARLAAAVLSCMVVLATGGNTATAAAVGGPADGGSTGIVESTFASGFTLITATGIEVTVNETSSTRTVGGLTGDVSKGTSVLVLGLDDSGTTIAADWVVIQPHGDGGAAAAKADGVIPFEAGVPSPDKSVGTIPASYTQGQGTEVSGIQAFIPVAVAQTRFPGGVVDRVVALSDGSYEVHNISINWPHHVFVSKDFIYLGAE